MSEFKKKEKYNFFHSPIALGILFLILVMFIYNIFGLFEKQRDTAKKKQFAEDQIQALEKRQDSVSKDLDKLKTEEGIEDIIREKYQVVKPGEKMVVIVDENANKATDNSVTKNSFWDWLKNIFNAK